MENKLYLKNTLTFDILKLQQKSHLMKHVENV